MKEESIETLQLKMIMSVIESQRDERERESHAVLSSKEELRA